MKKTIKPFATTFKNYGTIIVPIGVAVTSQTAMGVDTDYNFVDAFAWVRRDYPEIANILIHDLRHYGLNVPEEFLGPDENPVPFIPETDNVNYPVGPDGRVCYAGLSYDAQKVAVQQYMKNNGIEDEEIVTNHILLHGFKFDTDGTNCSIDVIGFTSERRGEYWFNHYDGRFDNADKIDVNLTAYKYSNPWIENAMAVFEREGCVGDLVEFIVPVDFEETCGVIEVDAETSALIEKDKALFVAFYYFEVGHNTATLWQTFDDVYAMAGEFVKTYSPNDGWEERSFEDYMVEFIKARVDY